MAASISRYFLEYKPCSKNYIQFRWTCMACQKPHFKDRSEDLSGGGGDELMAEGIKARPSLL